jgi:hypothetical protein
MHYRLIIVPILIALVSIPTVAASQQQVPTPTGFLGGRESAGETATVAVVPAPTVTLPASPAAADIPGASECLVAPGGPDFETITDPPANGIASPEETRGRVPTRTLAELPAGTPADDATVAAVTATIRLLLACSNSGNNQSFVALHTGDYFRRAATVEVTHEDSSGFWDWLFGPSESTTTSYGFAAFPLGAPMPELMNVAILPDGRVGAIVSGPDFSPIFFAFAREQPDGPYLVDETIQIVEPTGTPPT